MRGCTSTFRGCSRTLKTPNSPPLPTVHRLTAGRGAAAPGPASTVSGNVSHCTGHVRGKKNSNLFTNARKNVSFLFNRGTRNPSLEDMERKYFTLGSNFPTTMSRLFANRAKAANRPGCRQPALARDGDKVDFACASGGEGPVLQSLSALGLNASPSTNRAMHDFVTKLALLSKM